MKEKKKYSETDSVLLATDKKYNEARNLLAKVFRRVLLDRNVLPGTFSAMVRQWAKANDSTGNQLSLQANITHALLKEEMTWKTLMKGFDILNISSVKVTFECHHRNGRVSVITEVLDNETYGRDDSDD